jgi:hypothetical protein
MILEGQTCSLSPGQIKPILGYPLPQLQAFLGVTGFCCIWILGYADLARSLYRFLKEAQQNSQAYLEWDPESKKIFQTLKETLQSAPALRLPTQDHFQLYVYEKGGHPLGYSHSSECPLHSQWDI